MSDIDFDELDKAVNTLMGGVSTTTTPVKNNEVKTLTIDSTIPDDSRPSLEKLESTLAQVNGPIAAAVAKPEETSTPSAPARPTTPPLANRRSGRFMDVVHPAAAKSGPKLASRVGTTIQPSGVASLDGIKTSTPEVKMDDASPEVYENETAADVKTPADIASASTVNDTPTSTDWPDPLEMSDYHDEPDVATDESTAPVSDSKDDTSAAFYQDDQQPLVSPFIADAKVEKRPLGGASVEAVTVPQEAINLDAEVADLDAEDAAAAQLPAKPSVPEMQLPPELQSDLMAIETDGGTSTPATAPSAVMASTRDDADKAIADSKVAPALVARPGASIASAVSVGSATSIPQQYQEEPSTSDAPSGSIYDTDSYHQPLAHPAKTKSGWLWIIWILLLLLVGGGGAVALYFIGII